MAASRLCSVVIAVAAALIVCGCGEKQQLRSAVDSATPPGLTEIECDYSDEGGEFPYARSAGMRVRAGGFVHEPPAAESN
jgi:hypothetical protein